LNATTPSKETLGAAPDRDIHDESFVEPDLALPKRVLVAAQSELSRADDLCVPGAEDRDSTSPAVDEMEGGRLHPLLVLHGDPVGVPAWDRFTEHYGRCCHGAGEVRPAGGEAENTEEEPVHHAGAGSAKQFEFGLGIPVGLLEDDEQVLGTCGAHHGVRQFREVGVADLGDDEPDDA
jgi:hypothetical protein